MQNEVGDVLVENDAGASSSGVSSGGGASSSSSSGGGSSGGSSGVASSSSGSSGGGCEPLWSAPTVWREERRDSWRVGDRDFYVAPAEDQASIFSSLNGGPPIRELDLTGERPLVNAASTIAYTTSLTGQAESDWNVSQWSSTDNGWLWSGSFQCDPSSTRLGSFMPDGRLLVSVLNGPKWYAVSLRADALACPSEPSLWSVLTANGDGDREDSVLQPLLDASDRLFYAQGVGMSGAGANWGGPIKMARRDSSSTGTAVRYVEAEVVVSPNFQINEVSYDQPRPDWIDGDVLYFSARRKTQENGTWDVLTTTRCPTAP